MKLQLKNHLVCSQFYNALIKDGAVYMWGQNTDKQCDVPPNLINVVTVALAESHTLALKLDGSVIAWGNNCSYQCKIPTNIKNIVAIAALPFKSIALREDGLLCSWGGDSGLLCNWRGDSFKIDNTVKYKSIYTKYDYLVAVRQNGEIDIFDDSINSTLPRKLNPPNNINTIDIADIIVETNICLALKTDKTVMAWGNNDYEQCETPKNLYDVIQIETNGLSNLVLKEDKTVVTWGLNANKYTAADNLRNVTMVAIGYDFFAALKVDGTIIIWSVNLQKSSFTTLAGYSELQNLNFTTEQYINGSQSNIAELFHHKHLSRPISIIATETCLFFLREDNTIGGWEIYAEGEAHQIPKHLQLSSLYQYKTEFKNLSDIGFIL